MSKRGMTLRGVIWRAAEDYTDGVGGSTEIARAIVDHLGLTWEMVDDLTDLAEITRKWEHPDYSRNATRTADAIATLLEAAGVER
ncbi:MAG: hypothetical protein VW362_05935 [Candidatus Nanopelagicales bacterium]